MAIPEDVEVTGSQARTSRPRDQVLAILSAAALAAALAFWAVEASVGHDDTLVPGLSGKLWWCAAISILAWMISGAERRLAEHLSRIEGARYRDGYAAGYVDAASRRGTGHDRQGLRPVR
jgi:hypothetical protein